MAFHVGKTAWSGPGKLNWAEVVTDGIDKRGSSLIRKREKPEFWQHMALRGRRELQKSPQRIQSSVVVREVVKEVVFMICPHCRARVAQGTPKCENCGATL